MKEKTKKFGAWLLAATLAFAGVSGVADEVQQPTQAVDWFSAGFDGTDEHWDFPTGAAEFESGKIVIDTAVGEQVVYTPDAATKQSAKVAVKTTFEMTPLDALSDVPDVQAAFTVVEENEALCYYGLAKVDDKAAWVELTGVPSVDGANVPLTIEFDYSAKTVTYKIGDVALSNGGRTALPLADETKTAVSSVAYTGSGTASLLVGDYCDADRKFAVENAQAPGGYDYYATELEAQNAAGAGGVYLVFNGTGWETKTAPAAPEEVEIPVDETGGAVIPVKIPTEVFEQKQGREIKGKDGQPLPAPATKEEKQQFLVTEQPNGLKVWQNVAMGVNGNTAENALAMTCREPTAEEVKKAKDEGKTVDIVINTPISDFNPPTTTGVTVSYKLLRSTNGGVKWTVAAENLEKPEFPTYTKDDTLISEGDTFWKFQAVFTSQANEQAE